MADELCLGVVAGLLLQSLAELAKLVKRVVWVGSWWWWRWQWQSAVCAVWLVGSRSSCFGGRGCLGGCGYNKITGLGILTRAYTLSHTYTLPHLLMWNHSLLNPLPLSSSWPRPWQVSWRSHTPWSDPLSHLSPRPSFQEIPPSRPLFQSSSWWLELSIWSTPFWIFVLHVMR